MACPLLRGIRSSSVVLGATLAAALLAAPGPSAPPVWAHEAQPAIKPVPPIEIRLEALDEARPGRAARFRLSVTPRVPTEEVRVHWRPGPAVRALSADTLVARPAGLDREQAFEFAVVVPAAGRHALHAVVEIVGHDGRLWRRGAGLGLGPRAAPERRRPDGRGSEVIEYDAAPADRLEGPR